jgi:glyceraldehyde-3-phosphate dehydrogenase/erythrose-4-phosphate dehydrogenase
VEEDPAGNLLVNGKTVMVHTELDPRRIPWHHSGVNYVIEATESINSKVDASHHLKPNEAGVRMKDLTNRNQTNTESDEQNIEDKDGLKTEDEEHNHSVKKVVVANSSPDIPSIGIGINEDRLRSDLSVISSISAPANALILALKVVQDGFGLKFCAYTFIKAVKTATK